MAEEWQGQPHNVHLVKTGNAIARATCDLIESAQHEICITEYIFRDDDFGLIVLALLMKKAREGVRVMLALDALRTIVRPAIAACMLDDGVQLHFFSQLDFRRLRQFTKRNHAKLIVVDKKSYKIGDANIGNEYVRWNSDETMRSLDIWVEGTTAQTAAEFVDKIARSRASNPFRLVVREDTWWLRLYSRFSDAIKFVLKVFPAPLDAPGLRSKILPPLVLTSEKVQARESLKEAEENYLNLRKEKSWDPPMGWTAQAYPVENCEILLDPIEKKGRVPGVDLAVRQEFFKAKERLTIVTPYLLLTRADRKALKKALERGVHVQFFTNSTLSNDNALMQLAYELHAEKYAAMGNVEIYEYFTREVLHAKVMLRDQDTCTIMAYNLDYRSRFLNIESGVRIQSRRLNQEVQRWLDQQSKHFRIVARGGQLLVSRPDKLRNPLLRRLLLSVIRIFRWQL